MFPRHFANRVTESITAFAANLRLEREVGESNDAAYKQPLVVGSLACFYMLDDAVSGGGNRRGRD